MPPGGIPIGGNPGRGGNPPIGGAIAAADGPPTPATGPERPTGGRLIGATTPRPAARPIPCPGTAALSGRLS